MGLGLAIALGLSNIVETLLINQYFHVLFRISLHLKVLLYLSAFTHSCEFAIFAGVIQTCLLVSDLKHLMVFKITSLS